MCSSRLRAGHRRPATRIPGASSTHIATRSNGRSSSTCWSSAIRSGAATRPRSCSSSRARPTSRHGRALITHSYDTGAAWENLALQGTLNGLVVHGMAGFDYARAKTTLNIPDDFHVEAMAAVGRPGPITVLPEDFQKRESPNTQEVDQRAGFRRASTPVRSTVHSPRSSVHG